MTNGFNSPYKKGETEIYANMQNVLDLQTMAELLNYLRPTNDT